MRKEVYSIKNIFVFLAQLGKRAADDDLFALSNELAYKMLLSFFPFLIFLVSLLGFLNLEGSIFAYRLLEVMPEDVGLVVGGFVAEVQARPSAGILSVSLLVSIYSASNGFRAVIRGVNKAHGYKDSRNLIKKIALSAGVMLIFSLAIIVMLTLWIFSDALLAMLHPFFAFDMGKAVRIASAAVTFAVLIGATALIYILACNRYRVPQKNGKRGKILPGACSAVVLWAVSSEVFGLFISYFSNISVIYGSIAGIFILIIWINLISFFLLLGNTVNALLDSPGGQ
jgi:membrane protein